MTTPVTLTATGQSFELSVLSKVLRKQPLIDPMTGGRINSNAMEIDFELQGEIEDYDDTLIRGGSNINRALPHPTPSPAVIPVAPPIDFALSFLSDEAAWDYSSGEDIEVVSPQNDHFSSPISLEQNNIAENMCEGTTLEMNKNDESESHHSPSQQETVDMHISSPQKESHPHEKLPAPSKPHISSSTSPSPKVCLEHSSELEEDELLKYRDHAYKHRHTAQDSGQECDFSHSLESVSFSGPPASWNYSMGNVDMVSFLLKRDNNEYADQKLLNNTSTIPKRAKALCRRFPIMWGYQTDLKTSSQTIVSLMNSMNKSEEELEEDNPTDRSSRSSLGPLGPAGPPGARNRAAIANGRGGGGSRGSNTNQNHREGGNTAMHIAVWNGHMKVVVCLVEAGASLDTKNANNCTPLMLGCRFGHVAIAKYLLEHGSAFRMIRKDDICSQGKVDDFQAKKEIIALLNSHRRAAGLSYLR